MAAPFLRAVEVGIQRIGEIARAAARLERVGGAIQHGPICEDEALPRLLVPRDAQACQLQIVYVGVRRRRHNDRSLSEANPSRAI